MLPSLFFIILFPILSLGQNIDDFNDCTTKLYSCGHVRWIGYPFGGNYRPSYCGLPGFNLTCREDDVTILKIRNTTLRVLRIDTKNNQIIVAGDDLLKEPDMCSLKPVQSINNTTFKDTVYSYVNEEYLFLGLHLSCSENDVLRRIPSRNRLNCSGDEEGKVSFFDFELNNVYGGECVSEIIVSVSREAFDEFNQSENGTLEDALAKGFPMEYTVNGGKICSRCESSGGTCWSGHNYSISSCLCPDGSSSALACSGDKISWQIKLAIGVGSTLTLVVFSSLIYCTMKSSRSSCVTSFNRGTEDDIDVENFIKQYGALTTKRYTYGDIKKMTNSFKDELGKGGFANVFKGKLPDGRHVAVKVLKSSKARGQEFINEVASIGKTSHINVVALLGFCSDNQKRALIYEFMPNGSLDKYIYNHSPDKPTTEIEVIKLYEVALGIAHGLDYLHRGCNPRILHLDIKPHNILLDEDLCPKIADFGLAKMFSKKQSMVSILEPRGTIGYTAPEVFNVTFGRVSHKSDVYSYGVMILEMVGGRKNVDVSIGSGHTSQIYFPYWIYNRLEKDEFLLDHIKNEEENDYVRKMTIVGLSCIQTDPKQRPSINEAIEMLEGSLDALKIPPKPYFFSPPQSPFTTIGTSRSLQRIVSIER